MASQVDPQSLQRELARSGLVIHELADLILRHGELENVWDIANRVYDQYAANDPVKKTGF
jgi:hypothetical protein